jgi:hypothetical protein
LFGARYGARVDKESHARLKRAIESGDIQPDLDPFDLLRALIGGDPSLFRSGLRAGTLSEALRPTGLPE